MNKRAFVLAASLAAATLLGSAERSDAVLVVVPNASFNNPDLGDGLFTDTNTMPATAIPGWTFTSSNNGILTAGVWDPQNADYAGSTGNNATLPGAADGGQTAYLYLEQTNNANPMNLVAEFALPTSLITVQNDTQYTLTIALGNSLTENPGDVTIQLLVDDVPEAAEFAFEGSLPNGTFTNVSTSFTTAPVADPRTGGSLKIRILHNHLGTGSREVEVDNIRLDATTVPEPATAALGALAAAGLVTRRARRRD